MTTLMQTDERTIVRDLAQQVAAIALSDQNQKRRQRWCDVNALRKPDRAPVYCRPVGCWPELLSEDDLVCTDAWLRSLERGFRRQLVKADIGDDDPLEPWFGVGAAFTREPADLWGVPIKRHGSSAGGGAWGYDPPLKNPQDLDKLVLPRFTYQPERTAEAIARMEELLGDILPVRLTCTPHLGSILGTAAADLWGLNELMLDMAMRPEAIHRLMAHLRDATLQNMKDVAAAGLLTRNHHGAMTCSDPIGPSVPDNEVTYANLWHMTNSQEFDAVGPDMWREFCLEYQRPIVEQFGFSAYGCCENLTQKISGVLSLKNLRIFVCSAWTHLDTLMEAVGQDYCIMWRQKATDVVFNGLDTVRQDIEEGCRRLQGSYYQIVLRELQTLDGNLDRLHHWTRRAIEAAEKWA